MEDFIIASKNKGKLKEFRQLMKDLPVRVRSLDEFPQVGEIEETGSSFSENAMIKAQAVFDATGCAVLADDSGLEVDALNGAPGIYSARYAGPQKDDAANNAKLLEALSHVADKDRGAQFHCCIAVIDKHGHHYTTEGIIRGRILHEPAGDNGFGYDPLFLVPELGKTTAQLSMDEKNGISHRGKAIAAMMEILRTKVFNK
jgi:XTP/dITP diphosphohydrolase